jgi:hypothetical protein
MTHGLYRVTGFARVAPYTLAVQFDDDTSQTIDFWPVLAGELFAPLRDPVLFDGVRLDPEAHNLIWSNGADFDPATLHDWPTDGPELAARARKWLDPAPARG